MGEEPEKRVSDFSDAADGRVEFDLGVLERTRLERLSESEGNARARWIVLNYLNDGDSGELELRGAAREIIESAPPDAELSIEGRATLAECQAVLDGQGLPAVLDRFAEGWAPIISTGRGWYRIIVELDRQIAELAPNVRYAQIKEKFGGLRVYPDNSCEAVEALISRAEEVAAHTCETCGLPGTLRDDQYYVQTLCDFHSLDRDRPLKGSTR